MSQLITIIVIVLVFISMSIRVLNEYERGVIFRLGRVVGSKGPGIIFLIPFIDKMVKVSLRTITMDVPPQDVVTKDNVSVKVNAVIYLRVVDPVKAIVQVEDFIYATSQISQTTLRSVLGHSDLDELLSQRDKINMSLQNIIDKHTDPWGIKVSTVEIKSVDIPEQMIRAISRQAEAEREKRAKIIHAQGEKESSQNLLEAAQILTQSPTTLQLRYLQTMTEIATEKTSLILFPIPLEMLKAFESMAGNNKKS